MPPTYYRGCWHVVSRGFFCRYRHLAASSLLKAVYNPKAFVPHAASLHQAFAHCARFPTAASRRSLGRVSVPIWLVGLATQLPIIALVGRYPTNKLTGRGPIPRRRSFPASPMRGWRSIRYYSQFPEAVPERGAGCPRVTQPFATLYTPGGALTVRLACVRRAASVHPEPGSNSPFEIPQALPVRCECRAVPVLKIPAGIGFFEIDVFEIIACCLRRSFDRSIRFSRSPAAARSVPSLPRGD